MGIYHLQPILLSESSNITPPSAVSTAPEPFPEAVKRQGMKHGLSS